MVTECSFTSLMIFYLNAFSFMNNRMNPANFAVSSTVTALYNDARIPPTLLQNENKKATNRK